MTALPRHAAGALTLAAVLTLGTAACSAPGADDPTPTAESTAEDAEPSPTPSPTPTADPAAEAAAAQQAALEKIVAEAQPSIPMLYDMAPGVYSDITITSEGANTLVYTYVYTPEAIGGASPDQMRESLSAVTSTLQTGCEQQVFPVMTAAGITTDPSIRYTYRNPAGEEVFSYTCTPPA